MNLQNVDPAVSPAFNTACTRRCGVMSCSCTQSDDYWSSSNCMSFPGYAWVVGFGFGGVDAGSETDGYYVRAVRGGL